MKQIYFLVFLLTQVQLFAIEPKQKNELRISFGSCLDQDMEQDRIWKKIISTQSDGFVFLGDNIYKDTYDMNEKKLEYSKLLSQKGYIELKKKTRIFATWDDHDYAVNDSGGEFSKKDESKKIFLETFNEPKDSKRWTRDGVYDSYELKLGKKIIRLILLDTRYNRSVLKKSTFSFITRKGYIGNEDSDATVLGEAQWNWLKEELLKPADLKVIVSSIQFHNENHGFEKWGNFPKEKIKFLNLLKETKSKSVVLITGDRHIGEFHKIEEKGLPKIYELTTSPMNRVLKFQAREEFHPDRLGAFTQEANFGLLRVFDTGNSISVKLELHQLSGIVFSIESDSNELTEVIK